MPYARAVLVLPTLALIACGGGSGGGGGGGGGGPQPTFVNFQSASVVIGQPNPNTNVPNAGNGTGLPNPVGLEFPQGHLAFGSLYVPDTESGRVLGFAAIPTASGAPAAFVLGVPNFTTDGSGSVVAANTLSLPAGCCVAGGKLFVADSGFERVLIWNTLPTTNGAAADVAIGQPNLITEGNNLSQSGLNTVTDVCVAGGRVIVCDFGNNRVMVWNTVPTSSGVNADLVLGQPDFATQSPGVTASKMSQPTGVWSDGTRLVVCDAQNNRVLVWSTFPTSIGQPADFVLGQPDFTTNTPGSGTQKMAGPWSVTSDGTQLFVADRFNQRVLLFHPFPTPGNTTPVRVLGQSSFTNTQSNDDNQDGIPEAGPSARTFFNPSGVTSIGTQLFVTDRDNHRVLVFNGN
jgi:hypothetical protein